MADLVKVAPDIRTIIGGVGVTGYWKELGRKELTVAGDIITVDSLTTHRYYQYLVYMIDSGAGTGIDLRFNNDSGMDYAYRDQTNFGADAVAVSQTDIPLTTVTSSDVLAHGYVANIANLEKLLIGHALQHGSDGAGTAPTTEESVAKFVPSPELDITRFDLLNPGGGNFAIGSQLIVLGWVDTLTHGIADNFWKFLGRKEVSGGDTDNIEVASFAAKKWLMIKHYTISSGQANVHTTFNNDTGMNYSRKNSQNGGNTNGVNQSFLNHTINPATPHFTTMIIRNQSDKEKLIITHTNNQNTAGAANASGREEGFFKWDNVAAQITTVDVDNDDTGGFANGSFLEVWGSD